MLALIDGVRSGATIAFRTSSVLLKKVFVRSSAGSLEYKRWSPAEYCAFVWRRVLLRGTSEICLLYELWMRPALPGEMGRLPITAGSGCLFRWLLNETRHRGDYSSTATFGEHPATESTHQLAIRVERSALLRIIPKEDLGMYAMSLGTACCQLLPGRQHAPAAQGPVEADHPHLAGEAGRPDRLLALYRFNPLLKKEGKNPLALDSARPPCPERAPQERGSLRLSDRRPEVARTTSSRRISTDFFLQVPNLRCVQFSAFYFSM
ncbi:hypothetical protein PAPYR_1612 [Paratrimastix pyriformis]|uniref:Uncharacterized protein n=1 Tax=Paratrimastix pyriformis TaxID=342808 RepID=A0ABQ8UU83_9EUKA|nr:hypothetical protein PAPYR_1612 [Paratrimastix pyriformis]